MAQKRKHPSENDTSEPTIHRSSPISDRDSTFIGLFSPSLSGKELQKLPEIKSASHSILAWRRESNQQSLTSTKQYVTGHDDDGEKYGGKKVEQVLVNLKAVGSCVVARWYGGTMLGPVRFAHIENCAGEAVREWMRCVGEEQAKKRKVEEEKGEKERLVKALAKRDQSIAVLRALALEKEGKVREAVEGVGDGDASGVGGEEVVVDATRDSDPTAPRSEPVVQPPAVDYGSMEVGRLRALDKARDATLGFLLKRIDKAEAELAAREKRTEEKTEPP